MFVQDGFLYLIVTRHKLTVCYRGRVIAFTNVVVKTMGVLLEIVRVLAEAT